LGKGQKTNDEEEKKLQKKINIRMREMGCPALGIWVGFLKQPALPG
jgi:hypothetical protein